VTPKIACRRCEAYGVLRSRRGVALALLLLAFSACARPPEQLRKPVTANKSPPAVSRSPSARIGPTRRESDAGGQITEPDGASTSTAVSSPEPSVQPPEPAHTAKGGVHYLVVIGPREQFRKIATTPSDPEVVYVEEASEIARDGRREKVVMAMSKAAIRRFKAAAEKLGMEVRDLDRH